MHKLDPGACLGVGYMYGDCKNTHFIIEIGCSFEKKEKHVDEAYLD